MRNTKAANTALRAAEYRWQHTGMVWRERWWQRSSGLLPKVSDSADEVRGFLNEFEKCLELHGVNKES